MTCRRVGIVGFGRLGEPIHLRALRVCNCCWLGKFLYDEISQKSDYEVAFVWNRTEEKMRGVVGEELILQDLADCASRHVHMLEHLQRRLATAAILVLCPHCAPNNALQMLYHSY